MRHTVRAILVLGVPLGIYPGLVKGGILGRVAGQAVPWGVRQGERKATRMVAREGDALVGLVPSRRLPFTAVQAEETAGVLIRRGARTESRMSRIGVPAAQTLAVLSPRQARRLAILADTGELARIGRTRALLEVVERFGDRAMEFVWRHKAALAVSAVLTAFLADPQPFLEGARDLASVAAMAVVQPLAQVTGRVAVAAVQSLDRSVLPLAISFTIGLTFLLLARARRMRRA
jgi:hypothetical protein